MNVHEFNFRQLKFQQFQAILADNVKVMLEIVINSTSCRLKKELWKYYPCKAFCNSFQSRIKKINRNVFYSSFEKTVP